MNNFFDKSGNVRHTTEFVINSLENILDLKSSKVDLSKILSRLPKDNMIALPLPTSDAHAKLSSQHLCLHYTNKGFTWQFSRRQA